MNLQSLVNNKVKSLDNFLEVAKDILELNKGCLLSGSVSLLLQNFKIRRNPKDLDIYVPFGMELNLPTGCKEAKNYMEDEYEVECYERTSYSYKGINIDFFTPTEEEYNITDIITTKGIKNVAALEIIKMKIGHAYGDSHSRYKHKDDVVFMMSLIS